MSDAVTVKHADGVKCPRCYHWSHSMLPDGLCNRCVVILEKFFPSHEATVAVKRSLAERGLTPQDNPEWNNV